MMATLRSLVRSFRSLKATAWLIGCLGGIFLFGLAIPQRELLGREGFIRWQEQSPQLVKALDYLGLTEIYTAPVTLLLWALFFVNLALVMADRFPGITRRCGEFPLPRSLEEIQTKPGMQTFSGMETNALVERLRRAGYSVRQEGNVFAATRNRYAPVGTLLFHLGFFLLLVGGILTFYSRFRAEVNLAEGESFSGNYSRILVTPRLGTIPVTSFTLERVAPAYYRRNVPVDLDVRIITGSSVIPVGINRPYRTGTLSFLVRAVDVAPMVVLHNPDGSTAAAVCAKLKLLSGEDRVFPLGAFKANVRLFTDYAGSGQGRKSSNTMLPQVMKQVPGGESRQDPEIVDPALQVVVRDNNDRLLASGVLRPGETLPVGRQRLEFVDLVYWVEFYVGAERGLMVVYAAFAVMLLGLAVRFLLYRRDIAGIADGSAVYLYGRAEFFPELFQTEMKRIVMPPPK